MATGKNKRKKKSKKKSAAARKTKKTTKKTLSKAPVKKKSSSGKSKARPERASGASPGTGEMIAYDGIKGWTKASGQSRDARVVFFTGSAEKKIRGFLKQNVLDWQCDKWDQESLVRFSGPEGPLYVVWLKNEDQIQGSIKYGQFGRARDLAGSVFCSLHKDSKIKTVELDLSYVSEDIARGVIVGCSMAQYDFAASEPRFALTLNLGKNKRSVVNEASVLAASTNLARRLVDMPPNQLQPDSYAKGIKQLFAGNPKVEVNIWSQSRLEKEGMGLHLAVGKAAEFPPCLVHIRYRPGGSKPPMAFVGKGITFDSGGLDLKPASGMRLMKKDMGGSAAVAGLAHYMIESGVKQPADFYLALAENAVSSNAFRPGDILHSYSGKTVEIHNTDAEGRLVLADAMSVALKQSGKDKPSMLIDVATLTGAIKVGLGSAIGGLFSNNDSLAQKLAKSSYAGGDPLWHMPLYQGYRGKFKSEVADFSNAVDGFGGAINAALFLQNFAQDIDWAHLDIYAWTDGAGGVYRQRGGSGQAVQCLVEFIRGL